MEHASIPPGEIHAPHNWVVADEAARLALVVTAADLGKYCWQRAGEGEWFLIGHTPAVWKQHIGPTGADGAPGPPGPPGPATWGGITDKPDVIAAGTDAVEARTAIGAVAGDDPRLTDSRTPTGGAGGVLSGSYPNPGFAVDMATQAELDFVSSAKVDKVAGKGLSTEDYSTAEKNKLAGVATGATANSSDAALRDRSTHTGAQAISTVTGLQTALDGKEAAGSAASALSTHVAAPDPHPQYATPAEAAAAAPVQSVAGRTGAVTIAKGDVGLGNVDNTADTAKPVSTAQQTALNLKANIASPTFTGTVNGITKSMVGLGNADNTSDASKPVSTAQAAAIATATAIHPFLLIGA